MIYKLNKQHINEYNNTRTVSKLKPLCRAPFSNLYFSRNGNVISCCFNREHILGKYPGQTLSELWHGAPLRFFKKKVLKNSLLKGCDICIREFENKNFHGVIARHFDFLTPKRRYPVMMEFELDNICNLECIMCEGELSSSIRKNRDKQDKICTPYGHEFAEYIKPYLRKTKLLRFGGGEPFLIPIYYDIWDIVVKKNPTCGIYVQTNGTIINDKIRKWLSGGQFELGVSLDSLEKSRFEHIRKNARFEDVLSNIDEFISLIPAKPGRPSLVISTTVMRDNWRDIPSLLEFANKKNAQIVFNTVWTPLSCAIHNLTPSEIKKILSFYESCILPEDSPLEKHNASMFTALQKQIIYWYKNSVDTELIIRKFEELSNEEIEQQLFEKILEAAKDKENTSKKLKEIFLFIRAKDNYRNYLLAISRYPVQETARAMEMHTSEELECLLGKEIPSGY